MIDAGRGIQPLLLSSLELYRELIRSESLECEFEERGLLFAYRLVTGNSRWDWLGLAAASVANLYTGYLAVPLTAAAFVFVGSALLPALGRALLQQRRRPDSAFLGWRPYRSTVAIARPISLPRE